MPHTDAYLQRFEARIHAHTASAVALDATAVIPGSGGQPHAEGAHAGSLTSAPRELVGAVSTERLMEFTARTARQLCVPASALLTCPAPSADRLG
jgi:hypothetical protein